MNGIRLQTILFPLLAISLVLSLFFIVYDSDERLYKARADLLLDLKELDSLLDREVLLITSLQQQNYDPLSRATRQMRALKTRLADENSSFYGATTPAVDADIDRYNQAIREKLQQIERIKTTAAIVRNGLNYLPQLVNDLRRSNHNTSDQVQQIANQLYRHYIFRSSLDAQDITRSINDLSKQAEINPQQFFYIQNLRLHIDTTLRAQQKLSALHAAYLAIPSRQSFTQLHQAYRRYLNKEIHQGEYFSILLIGICTLLLVGLGYLFQRLERSHKSAERARLRLRDGVDSLNEAFALFDQDGKLVLFNETFRRYYPWLRNQLQPGISRSHLMALIEPEIRERIAVSPDGRSDRHNLQILKDGNAYLGSETPTAEGGEVWVRLDVTHTRNNELELRKLSRALEQSPVSVVITDTNGTIEYINPTAEQISGYNKAEVIGANPRIFRSGKHSRKDYSLMWKALHAGKRWQGVFRNKRKSGELYWEAATISSIRNDAGIITHFVAVKDDISERKQAEDTLRMNAAVFETTTEGILITDAHSRIMSVNRAFTRITGYSQDEVKGFTPRMLRSDLHDKNFYNEMWDALNSNNNWSGEIWNKRKDGTIYPQWLSLSAIRNSQGEIQQYVAVFSDITQRKEHEDKIRQQANFDALTGLPNRSLLKRKLKQTLRRAKEQQQHCALLFIDLDRFKAVNDTMGHAVGDKLLQQVAGRLQMEIRDEDTIARFGGDEFVVILSHVEEDNQLASTSQRIIDCLRAPFKLRERELYIGASIGISRFPDDCSDSDTMLRHADMAMYKAKEQGRNQYQFFNSELREQVKNRTELEQALRLALQNEEFELYYQPIVNSHTGKVYSVESLVRWRHPERGIVSPGEFIPLAEETGLIQALGLWVFERACQQLVQWQQQQGITDISVAINISSSQRHLGFNATVARSIIDKTGVNPAQIIIEITESMFLDGSDEAVDWLQDLKSLGVQLAIDDFGTGYSSLSYLKRFPIDKLKIDRAFIKDLPGDEDDASLVKAIIAMAHSLGLSLVAEGVENPDQLDYLRHLNCDLIQGYLFSRPVPAADLPEQLSRLESIAREQSEEYFDFII
ncbi:EAL domain-containing protein [Pontibacterium sp.]|uniref:EAL domain-containing protein n=1 Tax=Pontibacterium sp. TaxID=2036026 RepID=UPI0035184287